MADKPDWVRWYPNKWLSGVLNLTNEQRGVYIQVINVIFDLGECNADYRYLGRLCNLRSHCVRRIVHELIAAGKIIEIDAKLHQNRAETELKLARNFAERARLRASKRWSVNGLADASSQCQPKPNKKERDSYLPSLLPSVPSESENPQYASHTTPNGGNDVKQEKRGNRMPASWRPSEQAMEHCQSALGCGASKLQEIYESFYDWGQSVTGPKATKRDWDRAFINAVRTEMRRVREAEERDKRWRERFTVGAQR